MSAPSYVSTEGHLPLTREQGLALRRMSGRLMSERDESSKRRAIMQAARAAERERRASVRAAASADSDYSSVSPLEWLRADEERGLLPTDTATVTERVEYVSAIGRDWHIVETTGQRFKLERLYWDYRQQRDEILRAMREDNRESPADIRASEPWRPSDRRKVRLANGQRADWGAYRVLPNGQRERFYTPDELLLRDQREALRGVVLAPAAPRVLTETEERDAAARERTRALMSGRADLGLADGTA